MTEILGISKLVLSYLSLCCSFGDYISDQVVAPVREACAQAVGATFKYMSPSLIYETLNILLQMQVNVKSLLFFYLTQN